MNSYKNIEIHNDGVCQVMDDNPTKEAKNDGGVSNTPPNDKNTDKKVVIDWVSYTFGDIDYEELFNTYNQTYDVKLRENRKNDFILNSLLNLMSIDTSWKKIEIHNKALNGYKFSWIIGEFIRINFAGPKMLNNNYSTQLLFSGSACREFENYYNGSFIDLFDFLLKQHSELGYNHNDDGEIYATKYFNGSFKRIDIALDDFSGKEQNIYDLREYAEKHWWIGSYKTVNIYDSSIRNGSVQSKGFTIAFGSPASNQLVIYDKNLERKFNSQEETHSDVWFRYEMRFVQERANQIVINYIMAYKFRNINKYILSLLNKCIEFKQLRNESATNYSRQYLQSQPTLESWNKFIEYTKKIDLITPEKSVKTIDKKLKWINDSLTTTFAELYLINKDDINSFYDMILSFVNKGMLKINPKQVTAINKYLETRKMPIITDEEYLKIKNYGLQHKGGTK